MNKSKKKEKRIIPLRTSGETIIKAEDRPSKVLFDLAAKAEESSQTSPPTTSYHLLPKPIISGNISPQRDYTKVANSIARDAVPSGLFKGTSKATYDVLYLKTRGAVNPTRTIKAVQGDVLIWTNVSHNTLRSHLKHLQAVGLIKIHHKLGDNHGAEYEVFMPEEINFTPLHLPPPTTTQILVGGTYQNLVGGGGGVMPENIEPNVSPKTSFKDSNTIDDDDALADFAHVLSEISRKLINRDLNKSEKGKWKELAELLAMELEIAAARTDSISSIPAFLTEHLRRRLIGKIDESKLKVKKNFPVGKTERVEVELFVAEPLAAESRGIVLKTFKDYIEKGQRDFVMSFEQSYTREDWRFLMDNLD